MLRFLKSPEGIMHISQSDIFPRESEDETGWSPAFGADGSWKSWGVLLFFWAFTPLLGCAQSTLLRGEKSDTLPSTTSSSVDIRDRRGLPITKGAALDDLARHRHVYVGEFHGQAVYHRAQVEVLEGLHRLGLELEVGVEWLPQDAQPILDRWVLGGGDETDLPDQLGWAESWGLPFEAYAPIFRWARSRRVRIRGLNAPVGLIRRFAQKGRAGLSMDEVQYLPTDLKASPAYKRWFCERMKKVGSRHGHHYGSSVESFSSECPGVPERYLEAQLMRDVIMSAALKKRLADAPTLTMVILVGVGHIDHGFGIPERVTDDILGEGRVVIPVPRSELQTTVDTFAHPVYGQRGDFLWCPSDDPLKLHQASP